MTSDNECSNSSYMLNILLEKRDIIAYKINELKDMLSHLSESVFKCRYTDICSEIRSICMIEIGIWMEKCIPYFVNDSYLIFIYKALYDNVII